jgi:MOSC domain-containing protein YiiM
MTDGRVAQVSTSRGGVPKLHVAGAWVSRDGLDGDGHTEPPTIHGGPQRAVCLYSLEQIARVRADGHPVDGPGALGENLTLGGVDLGALGPGTRLAIGEGGLVLEVVSYAAPCQAVAHCFTDGRIARISPMSHVADARRYCAVVAEGPVTQGDEVTVIARMPAVPPAPNRAQAPSASGDLDPD